MAAADATGDTLRAFMPQRTLPTLVTGAAGPDVAVARPGSGTPLPPTGHAPFSVLPADSGQALLDAAAMAGRSTGPRSDGRGDAAAGRTAAAGMAGSLATVLVPAVAVGTTGRMRDAWRQMRAHRRQRDLDSGTSGRPG